MNILNIMKSTAAGRAKLEEFDNFPASSDADENPPVSMLTAGESHTLTGVLDSEAAGGSYDDFIESKSRKAHTLGFDPMPFTGPLFDCVYFDFHWCWLVRGSFPADKKPLHAV